MRKIKVLFINATILTATSFFMRSINIIFSIYLSNKIGSEAIGIFELIMSIYMFFMTISTSGINLAATKIVSEELSVNNVMGAKSATAQCIRFSLVLGIIASLLLFISSKFIVVTFLHNQISYIPLYLLSICLPFIAVSNAISGYFNALRQVIKPAIRPNTWTVF